MNLKKVPHWGTCGAQKAYTANQVLRQLVGVKRIYVTVNLEEIFKICKYKYFFLFNIYSYFSKACFQNTYDFVKIRFNLLFLVIKHLTLKYHHRNFDFHIIKTGCDGALLFRSLDQQNIKKIGIAQPKPNPKQSL